MRYHGLECFHQLLAREEPTVMDEVEDPQDTMDWYPLAFAECPEPLVACNHDTVPVGCCMDEQRQVSGLDLLVVRADAEQLQDLRIRKKYHEQTGPDKRVGIKSFPFGQDQVSRAPGAVKVPQDTQHVSIVEREEDAGIEEVSQGIFMHSLHTRR